MSRSRSYRLTASLALALGLLSLPAAHAAPAWSNQEEDPVGIQQLAHVVRSFFRSIAGFLDIFQMDSPPPGQQSGNPPERDPKEGVGVDPFGKPGPPGPPGPP